MTEKNLYVIARYMIKAMERSMAETGYPTLPVIMPVTRSASGQVMDSARKLMKIAVVAQGYLITSECSVFPPSIIQDAEELFDRIAAPLDIERPHYSPYHLGKTAGLNPDKNLEDCPWLIIKKLPATEKGNVAYLDTYKYMLWIKGFKVGRGLLGRQL